MMSVRIRYTSPRPTIAFSPVSVKPARPSVWRGDLGHKIPYFWCVQTGKWAASMTPAERGSCMSKHGSVSAVLLGLSMIVLAGCTGAPIGTAPDIPGEASGSTSVGANPLATSAAPVISASTTTRSETTARPSTRSAPGAGPSTRSAPGARPSPSSDSFVQANSIPFPVAVGNTWLYQTTAVSQTGQTTNRIVAAGAVPAGYEVTISSTTNVPGAAAAAQSVYLFHPDGTVGIPEPALSGVSVVGGGIRWPDAAPPGRPDRPVRGRERDSPGRGHHVRQRPGRCLPDQCGGHDHRLQGDNGRGDDVDRAGHWAGADRGGDPGGRYDRTHHEPAAVLHQGGHGDRQLKPSATALPPRTTS